MPIWTYWLLALVALFGSAIWFAGSNDGFCSGPAHQAVGKGEALNCFEYWLGRYQTLIGGLFTIIAAWTAWLAAGRSIKLSDTLERRRNERDLLAAKAVLPLSLDRMSNYTAQAVASLSRYEEARDVTFPHPDFIQPELPSDAIGPLQACVRYEFGPQSVVLSSLISSIQVVYARLQDRRPERLEVADRVIDCLELDEHASGLFEYSR